MRKLLLLVGAGVGYVLGARAGRERFDQLADKAGKVWGDPRVQEKVADVKSSAPEAAAKAKESAMLAAEKAKAKVTGHETTSLRGKYSNETGSYDPDGGPQVDNTGFGPGGDKLP